MGNRLRAFVNWVKDTVEKDLTKVALILSLSILPISCEKSEFMNLDPQMEFAEKTSYTQKELEDAINTLPPDETKDLYSIMKLDTTKEYYIKVDLK